MDAAVFAEDPPSTSVSPSLPWLPLSRCACGARGVWVVGDVRVICSRDLDQGSLLAVAQSATALAATALAAAALA